MFPFLWGLVGDGSPLQEPIKESGADPLRLVVLAKNGDKDAREELIRQYTPFVMRVTAEACGRYVVAGQDDEASIALLAFHEAIDSYQTGRGTFLKFSETVIKRRLIDYYRGQRRFGRETPLSDFVIEDDEGEEFCPAEMDAAILQHRHDVERMERQDEIRRYQDMLASYGISFSDLVKAAPKHRDAREAAKAVARYIAMRPELRAHLINNKSLPLKELDGMPGIPVSRKTIERNRKYIIALTLIIVGEFDYLKGYISL